MGEIWATVTSVSIESTQVVAVMPVDNIIKELTFSNTIQDTSESLGSEYSGSIKIENLTQLLISIKYGLSFQLRLKKKYTDAKKKKKKKKKKVPALIPLL